MTGFSYASIGRVSPDSNVNILANREKKTEEKICPSRVNAKRMQFHYRKKPE